MDTCSDCAAELTDENWYPSLRKIGRKLCRRCSNVRNTSWRKANPERASGHALKYYRQNREERVAAKRAWDAANRESIREREARRRARLRAEVLAAYGGACACCQERRPEFLAVDHINGDGAAHRRELKSRAMAHLYNLLKKQGFPKDRFRLLCHNCNHARGLYGYCPHERERLRA
jgi:rubrerythrin